MKKYIKNKIYWVEPIDSNQYLTVSYRKASDADVSGNYTIVTTSLLADTEGNLPEPLVISFPLANTEYVIRYKVNGYSEHYDETVKTPLEYTILGEVDKVHTAYPSTEYSYPVTGLSTAHLPTTGLLYDLNYSPAPVVGTEPPLEINGPMMFEDRDGIVGLKVEQGTIISFPSTMSELSVLGINEQQGLKDYSFGFWFHMDAAEFAQVAQDGKKWLLYTGDVTKHFGIYLDTATKFLNWEYKNGQVTERSVLDTQILPDTWCKVFVSKTNSGQDMAPENEFILSFNGTDHTPTVPINFTPAINYTGSSLNPIYIGAGKNSLGTIIPSNSTVSNLFYLESILDAENRNQILNPVYPKLFMGSTEITSYGYTDTAISFSIPDNAVPGSTDIYVSTYIGDTEPVNVDILVLEENETDFKIDFTTVPSDARTELVNTFWSLETEMGSGALVPNQVYVEFNNLALEAQGNNTVTGKSKVGAGIVSKDYYGYGSYKVGALVPMSEGAVFSMFVSRDDSSYELINVDTFSVLQNHISYNSPTGENDGEFHEYELRWYADRVEFHFDGGLLETITEDIPDKVGRFGIAIWFPGDADFMFDKALIESISFESYTDIEADGTNVVMGESFPFENLVEIGV